MPPIIALALAGFVDLGQALPEAEVRLKYTTTDNFLKADVYGDFDRCLLLPAAAEKLKKAAGILAARHHGAKLVLFDCLRPRAVQKIMWAKVKGTPDAAYVADPVKGSVHNYGCAVDLGVKGKDGKDWDMGSPFDDFSRAAHADGEAEGLRAGALTHAQLANRLALRAAMTEAGFYPLPHEWWHFDCMKLDELKKTHAIVEELK